MAGSLSDYAENKILAHSVGKAAWSAISSVYIALYTTAPNENTNGTEVPSTINGAVTSYSRYTTSAASWSDPSNGEIKNAQQFVFGPASVTWGDIEGIAVLDAASGGNIIWYGTFTSPRTVVAGEKLIFDPNAFVLSLT